MMGGDRFPIAAEIKFCGVNEMTMLKNLLTGAPSAFIAAALLLGVCVGCGDEAKKETPKTDAAAGAASGSDTDKSAE